MEHIEKLKELFVDQKESYLRNSNFNGKVLMLSGAWGSGKTHFWKNIILPELDKKKVPHINITLYGKDSLEQLKEEVFVQAYCLSNKKKTDVVESMYSVFSFLGKGITAGGVGLSGLFKNLDKLNKNKKLKATFEYLTKNGIVISFDDFERKSTKIDLRDLFGFITHLAIDLKCKIVIILNQDAFEGEDAEIFSRVKEKTVDRFIKFEPTIKELFSIIYKSKTEYQDPKLDDQVVLNTLSEMNILNARIYIQILENCRAYIESYEFNPNAKVIRALTIITVNFALYNHVPALLTDSTSRTIPN